MNKRFLSFLFVFLTTILIIAIGLFTWHVRNRGTSVAAGDKIVLKLGHSLDPAHPVHKALLFMSDRLKEKSGGKVELQIFGGGVLGSETDSVELLQRGALAMTKVSTAPLEGFVPEMAVFSMPYIFRDEDHYWNVLNSPLGKKMLQGPEAFGLKGLCYYDSGSRNFYTYQRPILTPEDLAGMKIRVMSSPKMLELIETLGASPTSVPWGELYTALQQKMVDGAENNPPSFYTSRHFEVCKYFSFNEHTRIPDIILMSTKVWNSLPADIQRLVQEAADESVLYQRKIWKEFTEESIEKSKDKGVEIIYPDKEPFIKKVQPMLEKYKDTDLGRIVQQIKEIQ